MNNTGIIILAAGPSSRLGRSKQLLLFHGKTLVRHVHDEAIKAGLSPVVIVTGCEAERTVDALRDEPPEIVFNKRWQEGMASGIVAGLSKISALDSFINDVIISVCDQPFLSAALFIELINKKKESGKGIVTCSYADTAGVPVIFDRKYFGELLLLQGTDGAKKLLMLHSADTAIIDFPEGNIDIDTEEDYMRFMNKK